MTDTDTATTAPAWLAAAETDRQRDAASDLAWRHGQAEMQATRINQALANLCIEPMCSAYANAANLTPAVLLDPDPERGHYGVRAGWDDRSRQTALLVEDFEGEFTGLRYSRLLNRAGDILDARENGPAPEPAPRHDFRAEALQAMSTLTRGYASEDAGAIVDAINGLTAAMLNLAEVAANRP